MGTMLQARGLKLRELPESLNFTQPDLLKSIHQEYINAGADFISANTFGANKFKLANSGLSVHETIQAALKIVREVIKDSNKDSRAVLDIGPTGKIMSPVGDASFDDIYYSVAEQVKAGKDLADVILFETFTDLYELKAAILAALENSDLPVFATMSFDESGKTFFGASVASMVATLENLGVSVLGVNCSLGPSQLVPIVKELCARSHIPVMVQPNAGLPKLIDGAAHYDVSPEEFAEVSLEFAKAGVNILGGCCGTTPDHIRKTKNIIMNSCDHVRDRVVPDRFITCSAAKSVTFGDKFIVIGERLNPTGKKLLQKALREGNINYLINEAIKQQDQNADVLDLNAGLPDIDEPEILKRALIEIQGVTNLPIQIDSSNITALESAARIYNGKPILNSVSGKDESLEKILPIAKKYGACILGLTLDENGIPETAEARFKIAEKIINTAESYGINRRDIIIDCLTLTASAQQKLVPETLKAIRLVKNNLGVCTVLGLSNVSFGLPRRPLINRTMLIAAIMNGLDSAIINPGDPDIRESLAAWNLLTGDENDMQNYISYCEANPAAVQNLSASQKISSPDSKNNAHDLNTAIIKGLKDEAKNLTDELLKSKQPLEIIEQNIIPALDQTGKDYETGKLFLPQLIKSAEAAKSSFESIAQNMQGDNKSEPRGLVALATVYGDVHDIGKNIVKTILENYNFHVIDLGKDVPPEKIIEAVKKYNVHIIGLSALMTTTVNSMKETIEKIRSEFPDIKIIAGGAVLTKDLAKFAGADYYAHDAMEGVRIVSSLCEKLS